MNNDWKRPESCPFPIVYSRFKGKKPMPDGRIADFWVQDATEDMLDDISYHLAHYFARDEPMAKSLRFYDNSGPIFTEKEGKEMTRSMLQKKLTVVALTDWPDGKTQLAGLNLLYVFRRGDEKNMPEVPNETIKKFQHIMFLTLNMVDVYKKYGVEEFTTALGLSVAPEFRGQNLGVELLKARVQMTRAVGLKLTLNNFTGFASQKQAERAGFELLAEVPYSEIKEENGDEMFPGIEAKTLQFRAKYIDSEIEEN